jgi:methylisocitrate lyase
MTVWLDDPSSDPVLDTKSLKSGAGVMAVAGAYDGISARLAARSGFKALYLSGAALSASMALPDLGLLTMEDVLLAAKTVVRASGLPVIVDCDTGFGEALNVMRSVRELEAVGVACIQIEDQQLPKKCGHLNDKRLISVDDMCGKIAAAKRAARSMKICARTDAASTSLDEAIFRAKRYVSAGADIIFVEALTTVDDMRRVRSEFSIPLLANMTEFGRTPPLSLNQWGEIGFEIVIYPVSALRVAAKSIENFYTSLQNRGDVGDFLPSMMTRAELYERIGYYEYEHLDAQIVATILPDAHGERG